MKRGQRWLHIRRTLLSAVWPERVYCLCCDRLTQGESVCRACSAALDKLRLQEPPENGTGSVWAYRGVARRLVQVLKYDGVRAAAAPLAEGVRALAESMTLPPDTVVTWVTMPEDRQRKRGIDHGRCLAEAVAQTLQLSVRPLLTRSQKSGRTPQHHLNRSQRMLNLAGAFQCPQSLTEPVLLVDDVFTTGATAAVCRDCLIQAGASQVFVLTATRTIIKNTSHES